MGHFLWKKLNAIVCIIICIGIQMGQCMCANGDVNEVNNKEPDKLYALSACLMDAASGRILFEKNGQEKRANASTTKIMTLIVTLENAKPDELVTVSEYAARQPDVQLNMKTGEQYLLNDLCYSLMLESHNDSAVAIAEHVGGSIEAFAKLMNAKAKEIGCKNTYFITPNGLDSKNENGAHGTTAEDLAKIMGYCITQSNRKDAFLKITQTPNYSFHNKVSNKDGAVTDGNRTFSCTNHNAFLHMMDGAISGKTGFTGDAGYCYVGAVKRDNRTFVVALLGCGWPGNKTYKWSDAKKLIQYGIDNYQAVTWRSARDEEALPDTIRVIDAKTRDCTRQEKVPVDIVLDQSEKFSKEVLLRKTESVVMEYHMEQVVQAPISMGEVVGTIEYKVGNEVIGRELLVCKRTVDATDYAWSLHIVSKKLLF
jgi:D-alanyl-D-alanine carboxypeptidase (penicillin-binding protein 5/6)